MKNSDRYLKIVEWSEEDQCYAGTCPGLFYGGCHGDNEAGVYKELCEIVEENIALYKENGKPLPPETAGKEYSGKFLLRPGKELHKSLAIRALQADESLNNFCLNALKKALFHSNRSNGLIGQPGGFLPQPHNTPHAGPHEAFLRVYRAETA